MLRRFAISFFLLSVAICAWGRTRPHYGGTLRVEIAGDPWQQPGGIARRLVYDGLTQLDPDGALRPALALSWESDGNNHRWQFRLRLWRAFSRWVAVDVGCGGGIVGCFVRSGLPVDRCEGCRPAGGFHKRLAHAESARAAGGG